MVKLKSTYYDQVQMQLAITTRTWSDFIFYTSKGMVIDRVIFDENHWENLRENILNFYYEIKCSRKTCFSSLVKLNVRKNFFT